MKLSVAERGWKNNGLIDTSRFLREFRKNIWKIVLAGVIAGAVAYPLISLMPKQYVSTATVLIKAQQDNVLPFSPVEAYDSTRNGYYETQYALMQSRIVLEQAIKQLGLAQNPQFTGEKAGGAPQSEQQRLDNVLKTLLKHLSINSVRTTHLATVSYESTSAQLSADIANGVARAFIDYSAGQKRLKTRRAAADNQQKLRALRAQIKQQKEAIDRYLAQEGLLVFRGIDGFETGQLDIATSRLADAVQRRVSAQSLYHEARTGSGRSLSTVISLPAVSGPGQMQDLRSAMTQAKRSLYELRKSYGPGHMKILAAQAQVQAIEEQTRQALKEQENGLRQQYQAAQADENNYRSQLEQQKRDFRNLALKREGYNDLKLELDQTQALYKTLYQRTQEQALSGSDSDADAVLYDPAVPAVLSAKPDKRFLLLMSVVLALLLACLYYIIRAARGSAVDAASQLPEHFNLEPLGEIPHFSGVNSHEQLRHKIVSDPLNRDTIHSIRSLIMLNPKKLQVITITSAGQGEGRTLLASLLANSFSFDQKTLLIDMDFFNREGLSGELNAPQVPGVADVLCGSKSVDEVLVQLDDRLDFLPGGNVLVSSQLLLSSDRLQPLIETLRTRYQRIIIDAAAVNQGPDVQLINAVTDGLILVLKAGVIPVKPVITALEKVANGHSVVIGGVLNQVEIREGETKTRGRVRAANSPGFPGMVERS